MCHLDLKASRKLLYYHTIIINSKNEPLLKHSAVNNFYSFARVNQGKYKIKMLVFDRGRKCAVSGLTKGKKSNHVIPNHEESPSSCLFNRKRQSSHHCVWCTFNSLKICPKTNPRLYMGQKTEIKKSSGQILCNHSLPERKF